MEHKWKKTVKYIQGICEELKKVVSVLVRQVWYVRQVINCFTERSSWVQRLFHKNGRHHVCQ